MKNALIPGTPILALIWEHAYYLGYQYRRKNYIDSFSMYQLAQNRENYEAAFRKNIKSQFIKC
jgi:Fe-Mn family superoxide dismutase